MNVETHSLRLKQMCDEVAEWRADQSAQQLKTAAMSFDERKTFAATKEDLEQNTTDRTADVPLLHSCEATPRRHHRTQHEDWITMYNEVQMDKKMRSA